MANEKRLIDANAFIADHCEDCKYFNVNGICTKEDPVCGAVTLVNEQPTVDAVDIKKYEALIEMYHDLRENFVDYVCSGTSNQAPYCLNRCTECVDSHGWCTYKRCNGFNPAEVILDEERRG